MPLPEVLASLELGVSTTDAVACVNTFSDGTLQVVLRHAVIAASPRFTLGQAIQLRDFLNRHIDELALKQTGSLAQRASDDPTQLASVEEIAKEPCVKHSDCPHAAPFRYCPSCVADPCPIGLSQNG